MLYHLNQKRIRWNQPRSTQLWSTLYISRLLLTSPATNTWEKQQRNFALLFVSTLCKTQVQPLPRERDMTVGGFPHIKRHWIYEVIKDSHTALATCLPLVPQLQSTNLVENLRQTLQRPRVFRVPSDPPDFGFLPSIFLSNHTLLQFGFQV